MSPIGRHQHNLPLDSQSTFLPDENALEHVPLLWLPDLEALIEPTRTDVPI